MEKRQLTRRIANLPREYTLKPACSQEHPWKQEKALIDCGATMSMGSWEELEGLAPMNEQRHGSICFFLDRTKKTWYTFAKRKKVTE